MLACGEKSSKFREMIQISAINTPHTQKLTFHTVHTVRNPQAACRFWSHKNKCDAKSVRQVNELRRRRL